MPEIKYNIAKKQVMVLRWLVYLLLFFILILSIWSYCSIVDIVVFCYGRVRPNNNVSVILNKHDGIIQRINYVDGQIVKNNDVLYEIDANQYVIALEQLLSKEKIIRKNLFNDKNFLNSVLAENNAICENMEQECYYEYKVYKTNYQKLRLTEKSSKRVFDAHSALKSTSSLEKNRLKIEYLLNSNASKKYFFETINNLKLSIKENEHQLEDIDYQKQKLDDKIIQCKICAPISGKIQVVRPININEYIIKGATVLHIIPDTIDTYKMEMVVQNEDIGKVAVTQNVEYKILTFNYKEYGTMSGKVTNISSDSVSKGYKVLGSVNSTTIVSNFGKVGTLMPGMLFESKIIVHKKRILLFLLEQLNVIRDFSFPVH